MILKKFSQEIDSLHTIFGKHRDLIYVLLLPAFLKELNLGWYSLEY